MTAFGNLQERARVRPPLGAIVLGSGMSDLADRLQNSVAVSFTDIPGLSTTSVAGHRGELLLGDWHDAPLLIYAGRLHFYEGHPWSQVLMPVRIARDLGARWLLLTNAVGGIRADLAPGSLTLLAGDLECTRRHWWRESHPIDSAPYSPDLLRRWKAAAERIGQILTTGIYAQMTGPSYETQAEIRALQRLGADVVGMSTAREMHYAREIGLEGAAISCVTNRAAGLGDGPIHHGEVLDLAQQHKRRLTELIDSFLASGR